ncbi:MAG: TonB-dependent receptor [Acidobacteria bacterium]|nr:TonB-dependent receptor [Acidobacteriota bacterium]
MVRDQSGAVLPGVEITVTQTNTGLVRNVISNETGFYIVPNLPTGPYRLEAALSGFRTFVQTGIVLEVNSNPTLNVALEVGQVTDSIQVQANAAMVETRSSGVGQVIENERILELPLNGRNVVELITLSGAAVTTQTSSTRSMAGQQAISVAGGLDSGVAYQLDGAIFNNPYDNLSLPLPFPDALQEFKVETSALSASQGRHTGAQVNSVTKSGTNDFHGSAFWFVRNDDLNARPFFSLKENTLKRNQFGGTLGGPIVRNKLFFFGGYQGTTLRQDPSDIESFVPTPAMLAGDFTAFASPACNGGRQITLGAPFVNNRIDPARFSPAALNISRRLPTPRDECGRVTTGIQTASDDGQIVSKADYQINDRHSLFGRFIATLNETDVPNTFEPNNLLNTAAAGFDNLAQSYAFGDTYLFGPNTINSLRLAVNRTAIHRLGPEFFEPKDAGINAFSSVPGLTILSVNGGFNIGSGVQSEARFRTTTYSVSDDVSLVRGAHQMAFGINWSHWRSLSGANVRSSPNLSFNGQVTGLGLSDFLTGKLAQLQQAAPNALDMRQTYFSLYGQDTWRVTPRLTLNYGARWEPYLPQSIPNGRIYNFSEERFRQGIKSTVFKNAPAGFYYPGDPGFPGKRGQNKQWENIGPRVGLAWDPKGDGRMSVRASYSLGYDFVNGQFHLNTSIAPPWGAEIRLLNPAGGLDNPFQDFPGGNPFPFTFDENALFTPFGPFLSVPFDLDTTDVQTWNLSVQRQLAENWLVSASYMGNQITHLWLTRPINPAVFVPGRGLTASAMPRVAGRRSMQIRPSFLPATGGRIAAIAVRIAGTFSI